MATPELYKYATLAGSFEILSADEKLHLLASSRELTDRMAADLGMTPGSYTVRDSVGRAARHIEVELRSKHLRASLYVDRRGGWLTFAPLSEGPGSVEGALSWLPLSALTDDYERVVSLLCGAIETGRELALVCG